MPSGRWSVGETATFDPAEPWDVVVAVSAFGAIKDLDEARGVLARMMAKASHAIAVLDVPERTDEPSAIATLQFDRSWMLHALVEIGASAIQIEDLEVDGVEIRHAFNVFARV